MYNSDQDIPNIMDNQDKPKIKIYLYEENKTIIMNNSIDEDEQNLIDSCHDLLMSDDQIKETSNFASKIFEEIRKYFSDKLLLECTLEAFPYGSFFTGTSYKENSDADFSILLSRSNGDIVQYQEAYKILKEFCDIQQQQNAATKISYKYQDFKVQLVTIKDEENNISIDIVYNNILGVLNSLLISKYYEIDPKIKYLCILFKQWARQYKFNGKYKLHSYSLMNMVLFFLIENSYIISLQDSIYFQYQQLYIDVISQKSFENKILNIDVGYNMDRDYIQEKAQQDIKKLQNKSLKELYNELFEFYQNYFSKQQTHYISIRPKNQRNQIQNVEFGKIYIEDPFDDSNDISSKKQFQMPLFKFQLGKVIKTKKESIHLQNN